MREPQAAVYSVYPRTHHTPLALGFLSGHASAVDGGALNRSYRFVPGFHSNGRVLAREASRGPSILLFSHYMWNTKELLAVTRRVKDEAPDCITVHGGPSIPKYERACRDFMDEHPYVDLAVRGEGEGVVADVLARLAADGRGHWDEALGSIRGITFRSERRGPLVRTADRERIRDLSILPSPFLGGRFDGDSWVMAIMETNRGCPYGCTFCDWGSATLQKIHMFPLDRIKDEIDWVGRRGIPGLQIVDANFGIFERDIEIAEHVIRTKEKYGFPFQFVCLLAKNSSERVTEIVRRLVKARLIDSGRVSIQTTDTRTLEAVRRSNIKTSRYVDLRRAYAAEKLPIATELILALPEQTVDSFKNDLQFCIEQRTYISLITCVVLPNSPMAQPDYMKKYAIEVDDERGRIVSTSTLDREAVRRLQMLWRYYYALVDHGVAKYVFYYLQHDHGLRAVDVLDRLVTDVRSGARSLPEVQKVVHWLTDTNLRGGGPSPKLLFYRWDSFYDELVDYFAKTYGIEKDSSFAALLEAQRAVMPTFLESTPRTIHLAHDVAAYVRRLTEDEPANTDARPPLESFPPASLEVTDPLNLRWAVFLSLGRMPLGHFRCYFELDSALSADVSRPHFLSTPDIRSATNALRYAKLFAMLSIKRANRVIDSHENLGRSVVRTVRALFEPAVG